MGAAMKIFHHKLGEAIVLPIFWTESLNHILHNNISDCFGCT